MDINEKILVIYSMLFIFSGILLGIFIDLIVGFVLVVFGVFIIGCFYAHRKDVEASEEHSMMDD